MEARIDGVNWTAELIVFTNPGSVLTIDGLGDDGTSIHVQIENYTGLGTYDLQPSDFQTFASWESGEQSYHTYFFGSGTVEITSDDESELGKQVGGTFSFTANSVNPVPTVTVTNGTFVADVLQVPQ